LSPTGDTMRQQARPARWRRNAILSLIWFLCFTAAAPAQRAGAGDATSRETDTGRRTEAAAPKVESCVREALREAERLSSISATQAVESLQRALDQVENDKALVDKRRQALARLLRDRIRVFETPAQSEESAEKRIHKSMERAEEDLALTDRVRMLRLQEAVKKLVKRGGTEQAARQRGGMAQDDPSNPAAQAASRATATSNQLAANRQMKNERQHGVTGVLRDVDKHGGPPKDDISFPPDWKQRTQTRSSSLVPQTAKEKALLRALNSTISVRFKDSRLEDVIEYLQIATGLRIVLDKASLDEVGVRYDSPVSIGVKSITVRSLLQIVLADLGLTYVVKDESLAVVSPHKGRELLLVRKYSVSDLSASACGSFSGEQAAMFINLIQSTIAPESWKVNGGTGTISYAPLTRSMVIKQSAEFHSVLSGGLR
jgi:hypothetical protein